MGGTGRGGQCVCECVVDVGAGEENERGAGGVVGLLLGLLGVLLLLVVVMR